MCSRRPPHQSLAPKGVRGTDFERTVVSASVSIRRPSQVTRRTREIGISIALGARRPAVLRLVALDATLLVGIGTAIGIPVALAATRYIKSLLYGVGALDPVAIAGGTLALLAIGVLACFVPARRATRVDPMVALRYE